MRELGEPIRRVVDGTQQVAQPALDGDHVSTADGDHLLQHRSSAFIDPQSCVLDLHDVRLSHRSRTYDVVH
jgi:hypothetical protein